MLHRPQVHLSHSPTSGLLRQSSCGLTPTGTHSRTLALIHIQTHTHTHTHARTLAQAQLTHTHTLAQAELGHTRARACTHRNKHTRAHARTRVEGKVRSRFERCRRPSMSPMANAPSKRSANVPRSNMHFLCFNMFGPICQPKPHDSHPPPRSCSHPEITAHSHIIWPICTHTVTHDHTRASTHTHTHTHTHTNTLTHSLTRTHTPHTPTQTQRYTRMPTQTRTPLNENAPVHMQAVQVAQACPKPCRA